MKTTIAASSLFTLLLAPLCLAQTWEVGGAGGYGFYHNLSATSPAGTAKVGFDSSAVVSATLTQNGRGHFGGEARYLYAFGGSKVESAKMNGDSHAFTYEVLIYGNKQEAKVRPFFAAGGGGKLYRGTGPEPTFQPLNGIAVLTATNEIKPLVSIGGGVKASISRNTLFRVDVRDQASPFPTNVVTPRPPSGNINGWLHHFVVMAGISVTF